jgi:hypothetical protein
MARDVSFLQDMRAHGNTAGPTQRPYLNGAICGILAFIPYEVLLRLTDGRELIARDLGINIWESTAINAIVMTLAGIVYAAIFKRAANDRRGGWLFGASYGFLWWIIAPISLLQLFNSRPVAVGTAAMGLFGAHVLYGLVLGLIFPWVHSLIQAKLNNS